MITNFVRTNLFVKWAHWHFVESLIDLISLYKGWLRFVSDFFSIIPLLKTLFSPWQRVGESYSGGITNIAENIQVLILNIFSRILGCFTRLVFIFLGIVFYLIVLFFGLILILLWIIFPIIIITGFIFSILLFFS